MKREKYRISAALILLCVLSFCLGMIVAWIIPSKTTAVASGSEEIALSTDGSYDLMSEDKMQEIEALLGSDDAEQQAAGFQMMFDELKPLFDPLDRITDYKLSLAIGNYLDEHARDLSTTEVEMLRAWEISLIKSIPVPDHGRPTPTKDPTPKPSSSEANLDPVASTEAVPTEVDPNAVVTDMTP